MCPRDFPEIRTRTPRATIEKARALCIDGNLQEFREVFDLSRPHSGSQDFEIGDFYKVMVEAIKRDRADFVEELFFRGFPMDQEHALVAVKANATSSFEVFLKNNWNINQPLDELTPPVLR
jgi:hypothetical protein